MIKNREVGEKNREDAWLRLREKDWKLMAQ